MDAPDYTYTGIGLTRVGEMPSGYRQMHHRIAVGEGHEAFLRLAEGILTWELHRGAGLSVRADWPRAVVGSAVVSGFGVGRLRLPVPCRVVWVEEINDGDGSHRAGFGYGTLPGHPESGEEAFTAVLSADGTVYFEVFAFSRPGNRPAHQKPAVAAHIPAALAGIGRGS